MELFCQKVDGVLIAADPDSEEKLAGLGLDTLVSCKTKKARYLPNHQRFFAGFLPVSFDMQTHFEDREEFRKWLTMKAGYYDTIVAPNGNTIFLPKSLAFAGELDEEEFKRFFSKCISTFIKEFNIGMTDDQFWELVDFD